MQQETVKLLVVKTDPSLPASVGVTMLDLREAILNQPEIIIDALRGLTSGAPTPGGGGTTQPPVGDLPMDTPIFKLLEPDKATLLTPKAKTLTKGDLLALRHEGGVPPKTAADLNLSVEDVKSIVEAFHQQFKQDITAGGASGLAKAFPDLCCCPCCTCTAAVAIQPVQAVA